MHNDNKINARSIRISNIIFSLNSNHNVIYIITLIQIINLFRNYLKMSKANSSEADNKRKHQSSKDTELYRKTENI